MVPTLQKQKISSPKRAEDVLAQAPRKETPMEFISSMAVVLVTGLFIVTFNLQAFEIPSTSMKNTLLVGDHLFVDRTTAAPVTSWIKPLIPYSDIRRGDIIVFISPVQPGLHVVKRIIGVPGDRIRLRNGIVFRNGQQLDEKYVIRDGSSQPYRDEFPSVAPEFGNIGNVAPEWALTLRSHIENGELVVPADSYFGMGDNRDVSLDSRYWGFIPRENIIGRPMFIYWSFETPERQYMQTGMSDRVGWLAHVAFHFFDETLWRRSFRRVH
jgi:signal peptidase I